MARAGREEAEIRNTFIRRRFSRFYDETKLPEPKRLTEREYGFVTERGGMWRHLAFRDYDDMQSFIRKQLPLHAYHSSAYYEKPNAKTMDEKVWLGADLVFDLDADHIEGADKMSQEEMFTAVKTEFIKLLDSYLMGDFGFDSKDIQIVFSGGRGYHAHVTDPRVLDLNSHERREIVDFITLPLKDLDKFVIKEPFDVKRFREHSKATYRYLLPPEGTTGWKGKFRNGVLEYLDTAEEMGKPEAIAELESHEGTGEKLSKELWKELFHGPDGGRGADIIRRTDSLEAFSSDRIRNHFVRFILDRIRVMAGETDEPVTSDIKRLIRLPGSIHGKTGFMVTKMTRDDLDGFEPLRDAVWEGFTDEPVSVTGNGNFEITLRGESIKVEKGSATEVPEFAALYLLGQKRAHITIH